MVVDDELLAEERVTFCPPAESHGSGRARPAGPAPGAHQPPRKLLEPRPTPPAGPPPSRPPAAGPAPNNFWGPPPSSARPRPRRPGPPPAQPPRRPRPALGAPGSLGPRPRALNPFAAGEARGRGRGRGGAGGRCASLGSPCPALAPRRVLPAGSWQRGLRTHGPTRTGSGPGFPTPRRPLLPLREGKGRGGRGLAAGWAAQLGASGGAGRGLGGLRAAQVRCWPASSLATAACMDDNEWTVNQVFTES